MVADVYSVDFRQSASHRYFFAALLAKVKPRYRGHLQFKVIDGRITKRFEAHQFNVSEEKEMLLKELREQILETSIQMITDELAYGAGGNISARDSESGLIAITPSALNYTKMKIEDVVVIDVDGTVIDGKWKPTSETSMHTIFYRERKDVGAVVHTHAPHSSVFAIINESVPMVVTEAALYIGESVKVSPYGRPGTDELAHIVLDAMGDGVAVLLAQHGLITVGATLSEAYSSTIATEISARLAIMARSMGAEPISMDLDEVREVRKLYLEHLHPTAPD